MRYCFFLSSLKQAKESIEVLLTSTSRITLVLHRCYVLPSLCEKLISTADLFEFPIYIKTSIQIDLIKSSSAGSRTS